ncbi:hypothetical protein DL766_004074 [Monosporascus sp. MC13-8B]|uniref:Mid2 domain-containing protein n=1 Tax=Monosporascus cannonballus TaxID=155416 RepID=A0ABY0HE71_9PEZI|nr:hypothetical protein DL762_003111 [Monosporascus cannonballus]RYO99115.1 hypothetical protein DL763_001716 [Monosporascus cannonballus]RYP32234.1 hypothetical protein DL766_004074 [Monosporascus sp. MC13-8B]
MLKSGLLHFCLLIALATIQVWANDNGAGTLKGEVAVRQRVGNTVLSKGLEEGLLRSKGLLDSHYDARNRAAPAIGIPQPTAASQKRQEANDDNDEEVRALSSQLQSLSQSATQAISSVSSSASSAISLMSQASQSIRQSADQAVRSASQNADEASRQMSQTKSSAANAVTSMSSRMSFERSSMQSSASSMVSAIQLQASASVAEARDAARRQIESARASVSSAWAPAESEASSVGRSMAGSISGTTVAIIVVATIIGSAIISALATYFFMRYRRNRQAPMQESNLKDADVGPAAARSTPDTPRFTPWGGGTYPMDRMKLPDIGSVMKAKRTSGGSTNTIGLATSSNGSGGQGGDNGDVYGVSPSSFRLQKPNNIERATSVRLIRVGSGKAKNNKGKEDGKALAQEPIPTIPASASAPSPAKPPPEASQRRPSLPMAPFARTSRRFSSRGNSPDVDPEFATPLSVPGQQPIAVDEEFSPTTTTDRCSMSTASSPGPPPPHHPLRVANDAAGDDTNNYNGNNDGGTTAPQLKRSKGGSAGSGGGTTLTAFPKVHHARHGAPGSRSGSRSLGIGSATETFLIPTPPKSASTATTMDPSSPGYGGGGGGGGDGGGDMAAGIRAKAERRGREVVELTRRKSERRTASVSPSALRTPNWPLDARRDTGRPDTGGVGGLWIGR